MSEARVTMRHVRDARLCAAGARAFLARHGLSWSDFVRDGLPADQLEALGDSMAAKAIALAREEAARNGGR